MVPAVDRLAVVAGGAVQVHLAAVVLVEPAGHHTDSNIPVVCNTRPKQLSNRVGLSLSVLSGLQLYLL